MFALAGKGSNGRQAAADAGMLGDRTLPKFLRKPVRSLSRLASGQVTFARNTDTLSAFLFLLSTGVYGAMVGGQSNTLLQSATAHVGFGINEVNISGLAVCSLGKVLEGHPEQDGHTNIFPGVGSGTR